MTKAIAIIFGATALLAPVATSACAINRPPDMRLESAIEREIIVGKAIVERLLAIRGNRIRTCTHTK